MKPSSLSSEIARILSFTGSLGSTGNMRTMCFQIPTSTSAIHRHRDLHNSSAKSLKATPGSRPHSLQTLRDERLFFMTSVKNFCQPISFLKKDIDDDQSSIL